MRPSETITIASPIPALMGNGMERETIRLHDVDLVAAYSANIISITVVHPTGGATRANLWILPHGPSIDGKIATAPRTRQVYCERQGAPK